MTKTPRPLTRPQPSREKILTRSLGSRKFFPPVHDNDHREARKGPINRMRILPPFSLKAPEVPGKIPLRTSGRMVRLTYSHLNKKVFSRKLSAPFRNVESFL